MENTLITDDRLEVIADLVRETCPLPGVMAECGTYKGGSAAVIAQNCGKKLHVFDSLGIPEDDIPGGHRKGEFGGDEQELRDFLSPHNVEFHFGVFPETARHLEEVFSFVHLDMDTLASTLAGLQYFVPRKVPGGVIVLDDLGWRNCPGVELALKEVGLSGRVEKRADNQGYVRF